MDDTAHRMHTLNTEKLLKLSPDIIRWKEGDHPNQRIHNLLDNLTKEDTKLARLQALWTTLNWVCIRSGYK